MSKRRFTDCDIWEGRWYMGLSMEHKLLWRYVCDRCDNAGVWDINPDLIRLHLGFAPDLAAALRAFKGEAQSFPGGDKWLLTNFVRYQYPRGLSEASAPQRQIIGLLKSHGLSPSGDFITHPSPAIMEASRSLQDYTIQGLDKDHTRPEATEIPLTGVCDAPPLAPLPKGKPVPLSPADVRKALEDAGVKFYGKDSVAPFIGVCRRQGGVEAVRAAIERMPPEIKDDHNKVEAWIIKDRKARESHAKNAENTARARQENEASRIAMSERKARDAAAREPLERIDAYLIDPATSEEIKQRVIASTVLKKYLQDIGKGTYTHAALETFLYRIPELQRIAYPAESLPA